MSILVFLLMLIVITRTFALCLVTLLYSNSDSECTSHQVRIKHVMWRSSSNGRVKFVTNLCFGKKRKLKEQKGSCRLCVSLGRAHEQSRAKRVAYGSD